MPYGADEILDAYAAGAATYPNGRPLARGAPAAWEAVSGGERGRLGAVVVHDSARRTWSVEAHRDARHGRYLVLAAPHGDVEPFRASADGYRPEAYLPISGGEWTVLALLAVAARAAPGGPADEELATAAHRAVDRMVRAAQHRLLLGAADDEEDDEPAAPW